MRYLASLPVLLAACPAAPPQCAPRVQWISLATLGTVPDPIPRAATQPIVLLGEQHDSAADHAFEFYLHGLRRGFHPRYARYAEHYGVFAACPGDGLQPAKP